jgi:hypothetical protein
MNGHYDIIGDAHGAAGALVKLLEKMGYRESGPGGYYSHPERKAVFVGDLIDRGMGNHEYNSLCYHTKCNDGNYLRPHSPKNYIQHKKVLEEIEQRGEAEWGIYLEWFRTMPLFLELDGFRVVHACWNQRQVDFIKRNNIRDASGRLTDDFLVWSVEKGSDAFLAIDVLLKGEEIRLPESHPGIYDKDGNLRKKLRLKWWAPIDELMEAKTYDQVVRADGSALEKIAGVEIPADILEKIRREERDETGNNTPVFFGHYWFSGEMKPLNDKAACLDYSVGLGGPLVCYRWDGEEVLDPSKFISA